ncbi:MAG: hypothetical protein DMG05_19340 [Acidobacteria bacterium]|nr:MAG: hypothetical protein DMG05_19340 [Acidobacteriota bacterium]
MGNIKIPGAKFEKSEPPRKCFVAFILVILSILFFPIRVGPGVIRCPIHLLGGRRRGSRTEDRRSHDRRLPSILED